MSSSSGAHVVLALAVAVALVSSLGREARAGGLEMPDLGTEALGRGGAFTAKASDATAVHYNVAGLAEQRGTHLFASANTSQSSLRFQREGSYADNPADPATPWGGRRYPEVDNQARPFVLPFVAATSDLGQSWMTIALAVYAPPLASYAGRTYPLGIDGAPNPARYDTVGGTNSLIVFYTGAVSFKLGDSVDIGLAAHLVQAKIETRSVSFVDLGSCKNVEYQPCDGRSEGSSEGWSGTGSLGALVRMGAGFTTGLHVLGPVLTEGTGQNWTTTPRTLGGQTSEPYGVKLRNALPLVARAGIRKSFTSERGRTEAGDVELDMTYERWSDAQSPGPQAQLETLGTTHDAAITVQHNYHDTISLRLGGAYNTEVSNVPLTLRAGSFYDSSATDSADTRIDADTLAKVAGTLGLGVRLGSFSVNAAYAAVADISRTVTDGRLRPINGAKGGASVDAKGEPLPAVNNGSYSGFTHVVSLGVGVELDTLVGFGRGGPPSSARPPAQGSGPRAPSGARAHLL